MTSVVLTAILGHGDYGEAWRTSCGRVVKLTTDSDAAASYEVMALRRTGAALPHLPQVHAVFRYGDGFGVLRDDIPDLPDGAFDERAFEDLDHGWSCSDAESLGMALEARPDLEAVVRDLLALSGSSGLHLTDLAVADNFGQVGDRIVLRDIGLSMNFDLYDMRRVVFDEVDLEFRPEPDDPSP